MELGAPIYCHKPLCIVDGKEQVCSSMLSRKAKKLHPVTIRLGTRHNDEAITNGMVRLCWSFSVFLRTHLRMTISVMFK
jgi:hypothetical protein